VAVLDLLFASCGDPAKGRFLLLGSSSFPDEFSMNRLRSLNLEHVSPAVLTGREISRPSRSLPRAAGEPVVAAMRRWFWARKPEAGFVLTDFPATLLQAKVFDEWLDARDEPLDGVLLVADGAADQAVVDHYRTQGLLIEGGAAS
jgi:adenylate kinase